MDLPIIKDDEQPYVVPNPPLVPSLVDDLRAEIASLKRKTAKEYAVEDGCTEETIAVINALRSLVPEGQRIVIGVRDYGYVWGIGSHPHRKTTALQDLPYQVTRDQAPALADYLFSPGGEDSVFHRRSQEFQADLYEQLEDAKRNCADLYEAMYGYRDRALTAEKRLAERDASLRRVVRAG